MTNISKQYVCQNPKCLGPLEIVNAVYRPGDIVEILKCNTAKCGRSYAHIDQLKRIGNGSADPLNASTNPSAERKRKERAKKANGL